MPYSDMHQVVLDEFLNRFVLPACSRLRMFMQEVVAVLQLLLIHLQAEPHMKLGLAHPPFNPLGIHLGEVPPLVEGAPVTARRRANKPCGLPGPLQLKSLPPVTPPVEVPCLVPKLGGLHVPDVHCVEALNVHVLSSICRCRHTTGTNHLHDTGSFPLFDSDSSFFSRANGGAMHD